MCYAYKSIRNTKLFYVYKVILCVGTPTRGVLRYDICIGELLLILLGMGDEEAVAPKILFINHRSERVVF